MSNSIALYPNGFADCWAEIRTHDQVMRYRRIGSGRPVLVLAESHEICPNVAEALADEGAIRLILPDLPTEDVHISGWVADFLEGFGATSVGLLVTQTFCMAGIELAMMASEQINRVVLVADEPGAFGRWCENWQQGSLTSLTRSTGVPMLLVHKGQPIDEVGPLVRGFLGGR
jgi:hypothetical protein